jgi:hypothetical protein
VQVVLGSSTYDVSHRALVIGLLDPLVDDEAVREQASALVALGADALAVDAADTATAVALVSFLRSEVPVVVATSRIDVVVEAARAGAPVLMAADLAPAAIANGVPADAILLDAGGHIATPPGPVHPLVVSTGNAAAHAVAIVCGVRLLRTRDVRGARRVADVMAAVLGAASKSRR